MKKEKPYLRSIHLQDGFDSEAYPFSIPAISQLGELEFHEDVTFFVGENGSGKSTALEAIALLMGFSAQGGPKSTEIPDASGLSDLQNYLKAKKSWAHPKFGYFLRAESFYNLASYVDELDAMEGPGVSPLASYGGKSLHKQSHGESFMATLLYKFKKNGLYLLDEPEAALSPLKQLAALVRINELVEEGSQFIIATHSPILLAYPSSKILVFDTEGLHEDQYENLEHFSVTRDFLNNYPRRLEQLFE